MKVSDIARIMVVAATLIVVAACSPEVGSDEWCNNMKEKEKGEWTVNEAKDFAKHCIIK